MQHMIILVQGWAGAHKGWVRTEVWQTLLGGGSWGLKPDDCPMRDGGPCASRPTCCCPSLPGLFFFTLLFYALSITAVALLFVYYTQPGACYEGKVFIGLNLTLCVCVSIVAVLPKIQVRALPVSAQPETRLLGVWDSL